MPISVLLCHCANVDFADFQPTSEYGSSNRLELSQISGSQVTSSILWRHLSVSWLDIRTEWAYRGIAKAHLIFPTFHATEVRHEANPVRGDPHHVSDPLAAGLRAFGPRESLDRLENRSRLQGG